MTTVGVNQTSSWHRECIQMMAVASVIIESLHTFHVVLCISQFNHVIITAFAYFLMPA